MCCFQAFLDFYGWWVRWSVGRLGLGLSLATLSKVEFLVVIVGGVAGFRLHILSLLVLIDIRIRIKTRL